MEKGLKILVVDDHHIVRQGLMLLLKSQADFKEIRQADGGKAAVELAKTFKPHVIVMDLHMPDMNGAEATRKILAENPAIRVIALTTDSDKRFIKEVFRAGAAGYLLKDCALEELVQAIRAVAAGGRYLSATVSKIVLKDFAEDSSTEHAAVQTPLTSRETEVLRAVAEGLSTKEIASRLNMSVRTVETHRHAISEKLQLRSIAEMTRFALRHGIISQ